MCGGNETYDPGPANSRDRHANKQARLSSTRVARRLIARERQNERLQARRLSDAIAPPCVDLQLGSPGRRAQLARQGGVILMNRGDAVSRATPTVHATSAANEPPDDEGKL